MRVVVMVELDMENIVSDCLFALLECPNCTELYLAVDIRRGGPMTCIL